MNSHLPISPSLGWQKPAKGHGCSCPWAAAPTADDEMAAQGLHSLPPEAAGFKKIIIIKSKCRPFPHKKMHSEI